MAGRDGDGADPREGDSIEVTDSGGGVAVFGVTLGESVLAYVLMSTEDLRELSAKLWKLAEEIDGDKRPTADSVVGHA